MPGIPGPSPAAPVTLVLTVTPALRSALFQGAAALTAEAEFLEEGARALAAVPLPPLGAVDELWDNAAQANTQAALLMALYKRTRGP